MKDEGFESQRFVVLFLILLAGILLSSCGNNPGECPESYQPSFQSQYGGGKNSILLRQNSTEWTSIDVSADRIIDAVHSISFNLDFDSTKMTYDGYLTGMFFEQNGSHTSYAVNLDPGNDHKIIVNISQDGSGNVATGSGIIVTLKFKLIAEGTSSISFSNDHLLDSNGQEITIDGWLGADIIISRAMCL
jgi:hypothetical protein